MVLICTGYRVGREIVRKRQGTIITNSVNINGVNGYFSDAMVLSFLVYMAHPLRVCVGAPSRDVPAAVFPLQ